MPPPPPLISGIGAGSPSPTADKRWSTDNQWTAMGNRLTVSSQNPQFALKRPLLSIVSLGRALRAH